MFEISMSMHVYAWKKQCYRNEALNKGNQGKLLLPKKIWELNTTQIFLGSEVFLGSPANGRFMALGNFFFAN